MLQLKGKRDKKQAVKKSRLRELAIPTPDASEATVPSEEVPVVASATDLDANRIDATLKNATQKTDGLAYPIAEPLVQFRKKVDKQFKEVNHRLEDVKTLIATEVANALQQQIVKQEYIQSPTDMATEIPLSTVKQESEQLNTGVFLSAENVHESFWKRLSEETARLARKEIDAPVHFENVDTRDATKRKRKIAYPEFHDGKLLF